MALDVDALPRRQAHALHAVFAWCHENPNSFPTAAEACVFDEESDGPLSTGCALREARKRGLCALVDGGWLPIGDALTVGRQPFEDRVARDLGWPE
jgi:hypothetical protein